MRRSGSYASRILSIVLLFIPSAMPGQAGQVKAQADTVAASDISGRSKHSFYAGSGYGSNMIYLGSTISRNQPYGYGSLIYGFDSELYASFSAVHLSGLKPFVSFYIGAISYSHVFNSWFDISAGIYRYEVEPSLSDTLFGDFTYSDLTLGFDWRLIYTKLSLGGLFSEENQAYFQIRNSRYFKTPEFSRKDAFVSFDPYVNLLFGTIITAETSTETFTTPSGPGRKWRIFNLPSGTSTIYKRKSGLMEIDFGIPVAFNGNIITIEAETAYVLPMYDDSYYPGSKGFIFLLSAIFRIF